MVDSPSVPQPSGLHVITGSPAALEAAVIARVNELRAAERLAPIDILIGGVLQRPYLQRFIADNSAALLNVRVSTVGELGIRLGELRLARGARRPLPAMAERVYAAEVGRGLTGYFESVGATPGFAEAARRVVGELRQEGVDPARFAEMAPIAAESPTKGAAIAKLYENYLRGREAYYDGTDALAVADPDRFDAMALLVFGTWRLSTLARRLLERIAERAPVEIFLPTIGVNEADDVHADLRAWAAAHSATEHKLPEVSGNGALHSLQTQLFTLPAGGITPDPSTALVSAPDALTEVREVARACLAWAEDGVPFRDMAVTYRQAALYRPLIEAVFAEARIPVYLDDGPSLAERPLGRRILALLDLIGSNLPRRGVIGFLADGWMPKETRERYGGANIGQWDSASRRAGVVEGVDQWRQRLTLLTDSLERRMAEAEDGSAEWMQSRIDHAQQLQRFVEDLHARLAALPRRTSWRASLAALRDLVETYIKDSSDVLGYLDSLAELDGIVGEVDFDRFIDVVRAEVRALKAGDLEGAQQGAFGRRGVNVLDANAVRGLRFRAVAILGLTERSFPPPPRQDPLLLDEERAALNEAGDWTLPLRARGADPEPLQFALAVHAARDRLLVSTRRADESGGRVTLPSAFFRAVAGAMEGRRVKVDEAEKLDCVQRVPAGQVGAGGIDAAATLAERDRTLIALEPSLGRAMLTRIQPSVARSDALRWARWRDRELTPFDGVFASPEAQAELLRRFQTGRPVPPTSLEEYATCPFRFFLSRVLYLRALEEPEGIVRMERNVVGSVMHDSLQDFYAELEGRSLSAADRPQLQARLREIAEAKLAAAEAQGQSGARLLWHADRQEILDDLAAWLDRQLAVPDPYSRRLLETSFGFDDNEPLKVAAAGHTLRVRGRVDRIDRDDSSFRVIDYKSGRGARGKSGELAGGTALQLPLYVLAGAMLLGRDPREGAAEYQNISRRGGLNRVEWTAEQLRDHQADVDMVLGRIVEGITGGDFHAEPAMNGVCRYCDFTTLCDVGRERIRERKADDPRAQSFAAMKAVP